MFQTLNKLVNAIDLYENDTFVVISNGTTTSFIIVIIQSYQVPDQIGLMNHGELFLCQGILHL